MNLDKQHLSKLRRLDEKKEFLDNCRKFSQAYPRFTSLLKGIKYDLQEFAHLEQEISGFYWKETQELTDMPSFTIFYSFDDKTVFVYSIDITPKE